MGAFGRACMGGALLMVLTACAAETEEAVAQEWKTTTASRQYDGEEAVKVEVEYAAGHLRVGPAADNVLYRAKLRYDASVFEPRVRYTPGRLDVSIGNGKIQRRNLKGGDLDLQLTPRAPLDLRLAFGAAEADLDLGGLRVQNLKVETGASATRLRVSEPNPAQCDRVEFDVGAARFEAVGLGNLNARSLEVNGGVGEVVLDFTGEWRGNLDVDISMGLGSLTLRVPEGLGVAVRKDGLLAGFDSEGLVKRGNTYYSEGYDQSRHQVAVQLDAALGSIKVVWTD